MSFENFFLAISGAVPPSHIRLTAGKISELNPDKIYVENVRSVLGISTKSAERICDTAVRQGIFERRIEVLCPDGHVAVTAASEQELPEVVHCFVVDDRGDFHETEFAPSQLRRESYYRLTDVA